MATKRGDECKLFRCATLLDGLTNTPALATWLEVENIKNASTDLTRNPMDNTVRAHGNFESKKAGRFQCKVNFEIDWNPADVDFAAIRTAHINGVPIAIAAMDGDIEVAASEGPAANWTVSSFVRNEPDGEKATATVTLEPYDQAEYYTVAGS